MERIGFGHSFGTVKKQRSNLEGTRTRELRPRAFRLETDLQPRSGGLGILLKSSRRGHAPAAFQTRDDGLGGLHALCDLFLREACAGAGFDQRGGKRKLFL